MNLEKEVENCKFRSVNRDDDGNPRNELFYKTCTKYIRSTPCRYLRIDDNKQFCSYETKQGNK